MCIKGWHDRPQPQQPRHDCARSGHEVQGFERGEAAREREPAQFDLDKDLFEIGCDSLKGMLILNKIKNELQVELSLMDFMEHSSVREVIETVETITNKQDQQVKTITI